MMRSGRGIELEAKLIVVAPCCHQELRPQLGKPEPLAPLLKHGLMAERMAEWVTDGLRALYLEWAGYDTKIFELCPPSTRPKYDDHRDSGEPGLPGRSDSPED